MLHETSAADLRILWVLAGVCTLVATVGALLLLALDSVARYRVRAVAGMLTFLVATNSLFGAAVCHSTAHNLVGVYYIAASVDAEQQWLESYSRYPIEGLTPVRVAPAGGSPPPSRAPSHIQTMRMLLNTSVTPGGGEDWFLISEYDAVGNFSGVPEFLRRNVCAGFWFRVFAFNLYSPGNLFGFGCRTTAYLVTRRGAHWVVETLEINQQSYHADTALADSYLAWLHTSSTELLSPLGSTW